MSGQASAAKPTCENCFKGFVLEGEPTGTMSTDKLGGLDYYLAVPKTITAGNEHKAIIIGTDFFGLGIVNPKLLADQMADEAGMSVYIPDFLEGDYPSAAKLEPAMIESPINDLPFYKRYLRIGRMIFAMLTLVGPGWFKRHGMDTVVPLTEKFCAALRSEKGVKRIGMAGVRCQFYCYGGTVAVKLAITGDKSALDVVVPIHAGSVTPEEFAAVEQPFLVICSGEDLMFDSIRGKVIEVMKEKKEKGQTAEFISYPGTVHGFAARPDLKDPIVKEAFEECGKQTVEWFKKYL